MDKETRIIDLTLDELFAALDERDRRKQEAQKQVAGMPELVYGLQGIQQLYRCSKTTASKLLRSGKLNPAVSRVSKKNIVINVAKALALCPNV